MDENKSQSESNADANLNANADANANADSNAGANTKIKKLRKVEIARIDLNRAVYWSIPPAVMLGICAFAWKLISAAPASDAAPAGLVLMLLTIAAVILAVGVTVRLFNRLADTNKLNLIISIRDIDETATPETTKGDEAESADEADEEEPTDESSQETPEQTHADSHWTEQPYPDPDEELFPKEEEEEEDSEEPEEKD